MRSTAIILSAGIISACGGGGSPAAPAPPPVLTTEAYSGSTIQTGTGSCSGDSHNFTAQEGDITVRLVATSDGANALSVQVCPGVDLGNNCAIAQQKIAVGQTLAGARRGASQQNLKLLPHNCVFGGPPATVAVTYNVTLTDMK